MYTSNTCNAHCRYTCDVSSRENVEELAKKIQSEVGDVNILINNAGILCCRPFLQQTANQIEQVVQVNLMGKHIHIHTHTLLNWGNTMILTIKLFVLKIYSIFQVNYGC